MFVFLSKIRNVPILKIEGFVTEEIARERNRRRSYGRNRIIENGNYSFGESLSRSNERPLTTVSHELLINFGANWATARRVRVCVINVCKKSRESYIRISILIIPHLYQVIVIFHRF